MSAFTSNRASQGRAASASGVRIHAQIRGEGEPLLLFSGIWGEAGLWEQLLPYLDGSRPSPSTRRVIGRSQMPIFPLTHGGASRLRGPRYSTNSASSPPRARRLVWWRGSHSRWRFSYPSRVRRLVLASTSFAVSPNPAARKLFGISSTRVATIRNVWQKWPAPCSAVGCAPSRRFSARCTSGGRPIPWPPLYRMARFSAGRACRGCGPSASPHSSSPATTIRSLRW